MSESVPAQLSESSLAAAKEHLKEKPMLLRDAVTFHTLNTLMHGPQFTVQIREALMQRGCATHKATFYRRLEKLVAANVVNVEEAPLIPRAGDSCRSQQYSINEEGYKLWSSLLTSYLQAAIGHNLIQVVTDPAEVKLPTKSSKSD